MFCSSCGRQLIGSESFCPYCGNNVQGIPTNVATPAQTGAGLRGFAKGWIIFTIILYSAYILANLANLTNPYMAGLLLPALILLGIMDFGAVLILRMNPCGFYIQLGAALMLLMLSGTYSGRYMMSTSGSIVVLVTWLCTKDQLDYTFWKNRLDEFILLEGLEKSWVIFIIGYLFGQMLLSLMDIGNYYYSNYLSAFFIHTLCGAGAIAGAALILNKRMYGIWIMLASILVRMFIIELPTYGNIFRMNNAEINRLGMAVILGLAPVLLTWLFNREQVQNGFGTKNDADLSQRAPAPANIQQPVTPAPAGGKTWQNPVHEPSGPASGPAYTSGTVHASVKNTEPAEQTKTVELAKTAKPAGSTEPAGMAQPTQPSDAKGATSQTEDNAIVLPILTADMLNPALVPVSAAPGSGAGMSSFQAAIQQINSKNHLGALSYFEKAIGEGINDLHAGYAYSEIAVIELMNRGNAEKAVGYWLNVLSMPRVFYESAHTACQYLIIVYDLAGTDAEVKILTDLLSNTMQRINYSLAPDAKAKIRSNLEKFTWRRE